MANDGGNYTRGEEEQLAASLRAGERPACPRCGGQLSQTSVPARAGLPYVRNRLWLTCDGCGRSVVLDQRRIGGS